MELIVDKTEYGKYKHYCMGCIFYTGMDGTVPMDNNLAYVQFSLQREHQLSRYNQACMLYNGEGIEKDLEKALTIFITDKDYEPSIFGTAKVYFETDMIVSKKIFELCLELKYREKESCYYLALIDIYNNDLTSAKRKLSHSIEAKTDLGQYFVSSLEKQNTDLESKYLLGEIFLYKGEIDSANKYFKEIADYHMLAEWRYEEIFPNKKMKEEVKQKSDKGIHLYMKIYADIISFEYDVGRYFEAIELYRKLDRTEDIENLLHSIYMNDIEGEYNEKLCDLGYILAIETWCELNFPDITVYDDTRIEKYLSICKAKNSAKGIYYLAKIFNKLEIYSDAEECCQIFIDMKDPFVTKERLFEIKNLLHSINCDEWNNPNDIGEANSPTESVDEFVKITSTPGYTPKLVEEAISHLTASSTIDPEYYTYITSLFQLVGVDEKSIEKWTIQGAIEGNTSCLIKLGKKWIDENID